MLVLLRFFMEMWGDKLELDVFCTEIFLQHCWASIVDYLRDRFETSANYILMKEYLCLYTFLLPTLHWLCQYYVGVVVIHHHDVFISFD